LTTNDLFHLANGVLIGGGIAWWAIKRPRILPTVINAWGLLGSVLVAWIAYRLANGSWLAAAVLVAITAATYHVAGRLSRHVAAARRRPRRDDRPLDDVL
jgi:hypothetical protein